jgi:hypothetical protein
LAPGHFDEPELSHTGGDGYCGQKDMIYSLTV